MIKGQLVQLSPSLGLPPDHAPGVNQSEAAAIPAQLLLECVTLSETPRSPGMPSDRDQGNSWQKIMVGSDPSASLLGNPTVRLKHTPDTMRKKFERFSSCA